MAVVLCDATHHGIPWQYGAKGGRRCGEGFGCLERGRLHQTCGLLWSSLAGAVQGSSKWITKFSVMKPKRHTYTQGGLTRCLKMWLDKLWTKWSSLGKRWNAALRGFPWESL